MMDPTRDPRKPDSAGCTLETSELSCDGSSSSGISVTTAMAESVLASSHRQQMLPVGSAAELNTNVHAAKWTLNTRDGDRPRKQISPQRTMSCHRQPDMASLLINLGSATDKSNTMDTSPTYAAEIELLTERINTDAFVARFLRDTTMSSSRRSRVCGESWKEISEA